MCSKKLTLHQPLDSFVLRQVSVKPDEDSVGVDVLVQVGQQVPEDKALVAGPVSCHPEPTVALKSLPKMFIAPVSEVVAHLRY